MMIWFDGSIKSAVDKVKTSGAFLLVFVQGDDNLSKEYEQFLTKSTKLSLDDCVPVKIPENSTAYEQFKQIYVSVPIPSVFLIENNGIPLSVVSSAKASDLQAPIADALAQKKKKDAKKNLSHANGELKSALESEAKTAEHVKNIGRKLCDISEEELKKRLKEIRAFPKFLLIDSSTPSTDSSSNSSFKSARIHFRLPNNTMPTWEFPDKSTLEDVRAYVTEKLKLASNFKLLRTYPRNPFTAEDEKKTLTELSLTPSSTLIVVPVEDKKVQARVGDLLVRENFFTSLLTTLLQPVMIVFNYFRKFFLKIPKNDETPKRLPSDTEFEKIFNKKTSTSNIHSFKFNEDPESDTENPDNGNSTQQRYEK